MATPAITTPVQTTRPLSSALSVSTDRAPKSAAAIRARAQLIAAYGRAFDRAVSAKLVCYRNADGSFDVPSTSNEGVLYVVRHLGGTDWANLSCTCAGGNHPACLHRAVVAFARKNHVAAVRPAATRCEPCDPRFCDGGCPDAPDSDPVHDRHTALTATQQANQARNAAQETAYKAAQSAATAHAIATMRATGTDPLASLWS